jgi:hypothetical protein
LFIPAIADISLDKGAILVLNLADNHLGQVVGWHLNPEYASNSDGEYQYEHSDGRREGGVTEGQDEEPEEMGRPDGVIAIASAIPYMGEMTSLDLSLNEIDGGGAFHIAGAIKVNYSYQCAVRQLSCCCLLLPQNLGAMTSLNLASNCLGVEGAKIIAACLPKCT